MDYKTCAECGVSKPIDEYYQTRERVDGTRGRRNKCKQCVVKKTNDYYFKKREYYTERGYWNRIRREHGITKEDYEALLEAQGYQCPICGTNDPKGRKGSLVRWHVDHCHNTGKGRGLLCMPCNVGMGSFKDDPDVMRKAAAYVEQHQEV